MENRVIPYEISLWFDRATENKTHFKEVKDIIIGASDMSFEGRAYSPELTESITGEKTLTFQIPIKYFDIDEDKLVENFIYYRLENEQKVKLKKENQWYTFIIKNISENRKDWTAKITCTDLLVNELSKNGYELIFDLELDNNSGTIDELAARIIKGSDWIYKPTNFPIIEYKEEVLYRCSHLINVGGIIQKTTLITEENPSARTLQINTSGDLFDPNGQLYFFYSDKINNEDKIQCIFIPLGEELEVDSNNVVQNLNNTIELESTYIDFLNSTSLTAYIGRKLIPSYELKYSEELSRWLQRFNRIDTDLSSPYYGFENTYWEQNPSTSEYEYVVKKTYVKFKTDSSLLIRYESEGEISVAAKNDGLVVGDIRDYAYEGLFEIYNTNFNKTRILQAEKSNRFNLFQDLCELFEVWLDYSIEYEEDGRIKVDENGRQLKEIFFRPSNIQINNVGFKYSVNLSNIQREIASEEIITKLFVDKNDSDLAENGICTIQTAKENVSKELFLLNFDYYTQKGLLDLWEVHNDLYYESNNIIDLIANPSAPIDWSKGLGYLINLGRLNTYVDNIFTKNDQIENDLNREKERNADLIASRDARIETFNSYWSQWQGNTISANDLYGLTQEMQAINTTITQIEAQILASTARIQELEALLTNTDAEIERVNELKELLTSLFTKKYSRYLQEGQWGDTNYLIADQYYIDAELVLLRSSRPNISYTIDVVDIGFEDSLFTYKPGDLTYVEDEEFFGYYPNGMPYREQVLVSEIYSNLDNRSSNKITVQNYKTQFEDLFQRIAAATQSLEFNKNTYSRAAKFSDDGEIDPETIQKTLLNNSMILASAPDQSIEIGIDGISLRDATGINSEGKGSKVVKLVSTGIVLGNEIEGSWTTGISAEGINTALLTVGQIDVSKINLYIEGVKTFGLDRRGFTSYSYEDGPGGTIGDVNLGTFVRLDQYGLYFIKNYSNNENFYSDLMAQTGKTNKLNFIKSNSNVSLTWDGFLLKTNTGSVSISSENDIQVMDGSSERIKIGSLGSGLFGIEIKNSVGNKVFETTSNGNIKISGEISATSGSIGGWIINSTDLTNSTGTVGLKPGVNPSDIVFWAGSATPANSAFSVTRAGTLKATDADISGAITASSGTIGGFTIGANTLTSNNVTLRSSGSGAIVFGENGVIGGIHGSGTAGNYFIVIGPGLSVTGPATINSNLDVYGTLRVNGTVITPGTTVYKGSGTCSYQWSAISGASGLSSVVASDAGATGYIVKTRRNGSTWEWCIDGSSGSTTACWIGF